MKALFIGLGSIGTRHAKDFYNLCKAKNEPLTITALRSKMTPLSDSLKGIIDNQILELNDEIYDVAFITNPTNLHYDILKKLKGKVKYYFIEKPIFEKEYDLSELDITENNAYIAAPMRCTKIYKEMSYIVKNNNVYSARIICSSYLPDWRPNIDYRKNYSAIKEMGGGVSLDLIHEIDYMTGLFGEPEEFYNFNGKYSHLEISSDDLSIYILKYPKLLCEVHLDYFGRKYRRTCELFTKEGTYIVDFYNETITCPDDAILNCKDVKDGEYIHEMEFFYDFVKGNVPNMNSPEHALNELKISLNIK